MHKLFVIVFSFMFCGFVLLPNPWELAVNKDEIKIYVRKSDSTSIKEYKAIMNVKVPMDSVIRKILDVKNLRTWNYKTTKTSLIKKISDTSWVFYMQNDLDWPIKDRDHVSRVVMKRTKKECIITLTPENNLIKENPDFIRIKRFKGIWVLKKIDEKQTQIVQQLYGDPESYVPSFIINSMLTKAPFETFKAMRSQLEKSNKSVSNYKN
ncbi:MAG: START domain-containing protein [Flavobacterium sp.]